MWPRDPRHCILVCLIIEYALRFPGLYQLSFNLFVEFRMSLYRNRFSWHVHALNLTDIGPAQLCDALRVVVNDVFVHLVDTLMHFQSNRNWILNAYQMIFLEDLLSLRREAYFAYGHFPGTAFTSRNLGTQCPAQYLVTITNANDPYLILR